jgi:N-acetyl-gamma-glutamyl-phosphate reductase
VNYAEAADEGGFLSAGALSGRDDMQVSVSGNAERVLLTARFDNLGKGASGAAIQNMNLLLGLDETEGLVIGAHG